MKLLVFAFRYTVAEKVMESLAMPADKVLIDSTEASIYDFISNINFAPYDYILGMGMYNGRDKTALRIETVCTNQFRHQNGDLKLVKIPCYLQPSIDIKLTKGIGNSYCNLVSYQLLLNHPQSRYTFLHIPKTFEPAYAARCIDKQMLGDELQKTR